MPLPQPRGSLTVVRATADLVDGEGIAVFLPATGFAQVAGVINADTDGPTQYTVEFSGVLDLDGNPAEPQDAGGTIDGEGSNAFGGWFQLAPGATVNVVGVGADSHVDVIVAVTPFLYYPQS